MARKRLSLPSLKKKAWKCFSNYIRFRAADQQGYASCVTCGARDKWKNLHAGHFLHGHSKPTFLVPENVAPQCIKCNHFLSGNLIAYYEYMIRKYGQAKIDELKALSHKVEKPSRDYYERIIELYGKIK